MCRREVSGTLPTPSQPSPCASQVLVQGCLLDPSRREAFLQQVYEQLCLFEEKVATMLQQQHEPQSQVSGRESGQRPLGGQLRAGAKRNRGWSAVHSQGRLPAGIQSLHPRCTLGESMKAFACEDFLFVFSTSLVRDLKVNMGSFDLCLTFLKLFGLPEGPASYFGDRRSGCAYSV